MKHLLSSWGEVESSVREQDVMLFLHYERTLTPTLETKKMLRGLASHEGVKTAIVSERPLAELKRQVGVAGLIYVGNYGLEIDEPSKRFVHPHASAAKKLVEKILDRLKTTLKPFTGVSIQGKTFSIQVGYRRLAREKTDRARAVFFKTVRPYLSSSQLVIREGVNAWEIRPAPRWNKGTTIVWLYGKVLAQSPGKVFPIYLGDGVTDEDAFYSIKPLGIGVKVGENSDEGSAAPYSLRFPKEVLTFLKQVLSAKTPPPKSPQKAKGHGVSAEHFSARSV